MLFSLILWFYPVQQEKLENLTDIQPRWVHLATTTMAQMLSLSPFVGSGSKGEGLSPALSCFRSGASSPPEWERGSGPNPDGSVQMRSAGLGTAKRNRNRPARAPAQ